MSALTLVLGLYVAGAAPPCGVDVVVSVDHSASIPRALGSVRVLQQSLERMASGMKPQDRLGLAFYSAEAKLYMPLAVRDRVLTEIGPALRRAGRFGVQSDMERGLDNAIGHQEAESRPRAVRVIVLLTDGDLRVAGGAEAKARARVRIMREMVARMRAGGIRLEVVTVGRNEPALLSATGITGGQVMRASGPELGDRLIAAYDRGRKTCGEIVKPRRDAHTRLRRKGRAPPEPTPGAAPTEETEVEEAEPEEDAPRRRRKKASNLWWIILIIAAVVLLILALVLWLLLSGKKEVPAPLPPPPSEIEREALSYRTESLKEPCAWHLERQGVGPCYVCNRMVCAECGVPHGPRYLCPEHVSHAQIARPKKRRRRPAPPGEGVPRRSRRAKAPPPGDSRVPEEVLAHALEAHDYAPAPGRKPAPPPPAREGDRHVKLRALPLSLLNEMQDMLGDWAPYDLPPGGEEDELEAALRSWDRLPPRIREEHYGGDMKRFLRDYMRVRYGCASPWGSGAQQASHWVMEHLDLWLRASRLWTATMAGVDWDSQEAIRKDLDLTILNTELEHLMPRLAEERHDVLRDLSRRLWRAGGRSMVAADGEIPGGMPPSKIRESTLEILDEERGRLDGFAFTSRDWSTFERLDQDRGGLLRAVITVLEQFQDFAAQGG